MNQAARKTTGSLTTPPGARRCFCRRVEGLSANHYENSTRNRQGFLPTRSAAPVSRPQRHKDGLGLKTLGDSARSLSGWPARACSARRMGSRR
jgi:hypothetical protein